MNIKSIVLYCLVFTLASKSVAQGDLFFYADAMVNAQDVNNRSFAQSKFSNLVYEKLSSDKDFKFNITNFPWISQKMPADSTFRLITWQVKNTEESYSHYGLLQLKGNAPITLIDQSKELGKSEYEQLDKENWYGALYYDMRYIPEGNYYLLFGFNGSVGEEYTKLVDVLTFNKDQQPVFGKEVFVIDSTGSRPDIKTRISVGYSPSTVVACRLTENGETIIHDYTTPEITGYDGSKIGKVPDGTYVAYYKQGAKWIRIDKLENTAQPLKSPDYNSKRDNSKSNIFGKKKQ
jgi:hypothetical protein